MDRDKHLATIAFLLTIIAAATLGAMLHVARDVIVPFVLAALGAVTVEPIVRFMLRLRIPRWLAAFLVLALLFFGVQLSVGILAVSSQEMADRLPVYLERLQGLVDMLPLGAGEAGRLRIDEPEFWTQLLPAPVVYGSVGTWAGEITGFIARAMLVLLLMLALVIARKPFDERLREVTAQATGSLEDSVQIIRAIDQGIQSYVQLKTLTSLAMGLLYTLVLMLFGVEFAIMWGFLAILLNYIPTVGPVLATLPVLIQIAFQFGHEPAFMVVTMISAAAVPTFMVNLVEPKLFGDSLNLNFFAVIFALLLWSFLWGLPGAFLSIPITMALSLVCKEVPGLRTVHDLLRA